MTRAAIQTAAARLDGGVVIPVDVGHEHGGVIDFAFSPNIGVKMLKTLAALNSSGRTDNQANVDRVILISDYLDRLAIGPNADLWRKYVEDEVIDVVTVSSVFKALREDASPVDPTQPTSSVDGSLPTGDTSTAGAPPEV